MTKSGILIAALFMALLLPARDARATPQCVKEYNDSSLDYWNIVNDMLQFKVMFDNYDRLCSRYYPDEIAALRSSADLLRRQVAIDMINADRVVSHIFDNTLSAKVSAQCRGDEESKQAVKAAFRATMQNKTRLMSARLEKSALTLRNPRKDLKLCRDLKKYKPVLEKKLGPGLTNPLLEMSELNSHHIAKDSARLREAYAVYRKTLNSLP